MQLITESQLVYTLARELQFERNISTDLVREKAEMIAKDDVTVAMYIYKFNDIDYRLLGDKVIQKLNYLYR